MGCRDAVETNPTQRKSQAGESSPLWDRKSHDSPETARLSPVFAAVPYFSNERCESVNGVWSSDFDFEVLTSAELAERLKVKESWVVDQSKPCRTHDPTPVSGLGSIGGIAGVLLN